jgi:hypothetical protein
MLHELLEGLSTHAYRWNLQLDILKDMAANYQPDQDEKYYFVMTYEQD